QSFIPLACFADVFGDVSNSVEQADLRHVPQVMMVRNRSMTEDRNSPFGVLHLFARAEVDAILAEPWPQQWIDLIQELKEREQHQPSASVPSPHRVHHKKKSNT